MLRVIQLSITELLLLSLISCAQPVVKESEPVVVQAAFQSTYNPIPSESVLIKNATLLTGTGELLQGTSILLDGGRIQEIGEEIAISADTIVIEAEGKWVTPGIIDVHSHLGVYPSPSHDANRDGNEATDPNTAEVWAEHSVWTQDPQFTLALAGGVTTLQVLPGSANLFGGRGVTLKNLPTRSVQEMKFPGAPYSLKMACGENPSRVYGERRRSPSTRMANVAGYRSAWIKAQTYLKKLEDYEQKLAEGEEPDAPERDLQLETLAEVLRGNILVHNHCYRGEEMAVMMEIAREFNYTITAFHHAVEAYKVADLLAENNICAAMWPDWWGFKHEAYDMVEENVAMVDAAGACAIIHTDDPHGIQHLNQEAAKVMASGNRAGYGIDRAQAIKWITLNAANALGIGEQTGSLEIGKMADVVLWDGDPFSIYTKVDKVFIDGAQVYDQNNRSLQPVTDFDLGIIDPQGERL